MAQNPSPQPSNGEKRFFRSREVVDFVNPNAVPITTRENGTAYQLADLIADRKNIILSKHELDLTDGNVETLVNGTIDRILPVTDEERNDPSRTGRARTRERLRAALATTENDEAFADACASYMLDEARREGKRFVPDREQILDLAVAKFDASKKYTANLSQEHKAQAQEAASAYLAEFTSDMAKRTKKSFETTGKKEKIGETRKELADMLSGLASDFYFNLDDRWSDEQKSKKVDQYINSVSEQIISAIEAERVAEYENSRPIVKKFYDKWAEWSKGKDDGSEKSALLTKGKLKKAAIFAVPSAVVATAAAPIIGAGAATAGVGALAFMGARSVGRRLAAAKLDRASGITTVAHEQAELLRAGIDTELNVDHNTVLEMIDKQSEYIQKRNMRRTMAGTAIALTVGLVSSRAAGAVEGLVEYISDRNPFGDQTSGGQLEKGERDTTKLLRDRDGDGVRNGRDFAPDDPNVSEPPAGPNAESSLFDGNRGTTELTPEGHEAMTEYLDGYTVKSGDSVWSLSEKFLHEQGSANPSVYEIDATKDVLLQELRASGNVDSNGWLATGDTIKIK